MHSSRQLALYALIQFSAHSYADAHWCSRTPQPPLLYSTAINKLPQAFTELAEQGASLQHSCGSNNRPDRQLAYPFYKTNKNKQRPTSLP